jgi:hypothetical protein
MLDSLAALPSTPWESFEPPSLDVVTYFRPLDFLFIQYPSPTYLPSQPHPPPKGKEIAKAKSRDEEQKKTIVFPWF